MFFCLYYSITFNELKEKFKIVFRRFSAIEKDSCTIISSNFPVKLICLGIVVCLP